MTRKSKKEEIIDTLGLEERPKKKKRFGKKIIITAFIAVPVLLIVLIGLPENTTRSVEYKTEAVKRGDLVISITATGNLAPTNKVEVGSELSGIVKTVMVDFNDQVRERQPLASLDNTNYTAAVMEAKAALVSAEARLKQADASLVLKEQNMKRLKQVHRLSGGKAPSKNEMELAEAELHRARADLSSAQAGIQQAQARLTIDETNLSKTVVYSPINGVVLRRNVDPGQTVAASLQAPVLFTLAEDLTQLELQVDVDEADVGLIKQGQEATFTVESHPDRTFNARITQLRYDSQINNGVVTYPTLLSVDNPGLMLRPGMTATVRIEAMKIMNTLMIPNEALRFRPPEHKKNASKKTGLFRMFTLKSNAAPPEPEKEHWKAGESHVYILKGDQLKAVGMRTGLSDGRHTAITDTQLKAGDQVVLEVVVPE